MSTNKKVFVSMFFDRKLVAIADVLAKDCGLNRTEYVKRLIIREMRLRYKAYVASKNNVTVDLSPEVLGAVDYLSKELGLEREKVVEDAVKIACGQLVAKVAELAKGTEVKS